MVYHWGGARAHTPIAHISRHHFRVPVNTTSVIAEHRLVRRGLLLNYATIAYNSLEAIAALVTGFLAGSVALVGFGIDSVIEVTASGAAQWRLRVNLDPSRRHQVEQMTLRIIGWSFIALAVYVAIDSARTLVLRARPEPSALGIVILALSAVVMPLLARAKRRVAREMGSAALESEAAQTSLCAYLSIIALGGVALNALFGWWWADPAAALAMVPIIAREGREALRGDSCETC
jgi:divalent metal cation (Fe/Co/Zn/Cd) transporter